jgi:hypothetical protein
MNALRTRAGYDEHASGWYEGKLCLSDDQSGRLIVWRRAWSSRGGRYRLPDARPVNAPDLRSRGPSNPATLAAAHGRSSFRSGLKRMGGRHSLAIRRTVMPTLPSRLGAKIELCGAMSSLPPVPTVW